MDHTRGLKYIQEFADNLTKISPPTITKVRGKPYTKISFKPDYARLHMQGLTSQMSLLLKKRVYDIAAVTDKKVQVKYNSLVIPIKDFRQYVDYYIGDKDGTPRVYECINARWEYTVCLTLRDEFTQVSFVNGINTSKGGKHVEYILNQIVRKLVAYIKKKKKIDVKPATIKEQLMLFINCSIENPSFDSQVKDYMNTPMNKFGSNCSVSDKFIEKVAKLGVMETAISLTEIKDNNAAKKTDGAKTRTIRGIPKLIDANYAGTDKSSECMLILCEGDSAKAGIVSGLSKEDRNLLGIYPMRGKLFNVRGETNKRISDIVEINDIKKILGLEIDKKYETVEEINQYLRYGRVIFMTDQDLDGSHIKGLGINLFQSQWHSLSKNAQFLGFMNTPILKATKGTQKLVFYNDGEYEEWKKNNDVKGWKIKYYKGLGTSTGKEFKEYFADKKIVTFYHEGTSSDDAIDKVFNKKRADDRKTWLSTYERTRYLDTNKDIVTYDDFIDCEMIHFSKYDCDRSIPNLMDGLKISLRKILYAAFLKNLKDEIKVAQFSGYVSEKSGYHHGEASLNQAIVGMAQNFVGSNNINLFQPNGQFGTRLQGGKDSASERYIYTKLSSITRLIYPEVDNKILTYLDDDGISVEPIYYCPIIPMILVNGSKGIGTGFSTDIMCYNPLQIIDYLMGRLRGNTIYLLPSIEPYYEGFKGQIIKTDPHRYLIKGIYEKVGVNKIRITELPVGTWTDDYKQFLENMMEVGEKKKKHKSIVKSYNDMSTDNVVDITITLTKASLIKLETQKSKSPYYNEIEKVFKLTSSHITSNMHMFNDREQLRKYESIEEIISDYYSVRYEMYKKRKAYLIKTLTGELLVISNKARFIQENLSGVINLMRMRKSAVSELLKERKYTIIDGDEDFKYLVRLPIDSFLQENVDKLMNEKTIAQQQLEKIQTTSIERMWLRELKEIAQRVSETKRKK